MVIGAITRPTVDISFVHYFIIWSYPFITTFCCSKKTTPYCFFYWFCLIVGFLRNSSGITLTVFVELRHSAINTSQLQLCGGGEGVKRCGERGAWCSNFHNTVRVI